MMAKIKTPASSYPDLCEINNIKTFLIVNEHLYIFYKKWVWLKKLDDDNYKSKPIALTDWLKFLPDNFTHIYRQTEWKYSVLHT